MYNWSCRDATLTEWLDASAFEDAQITRNLRDIRRLNWMLGWTQYAIHLVHTILRTDPTRPWTMLDIASGSADIPHAIARWSTRHGYTLGITASDISPQIVTVAREVCRTTPSVTVRQLDALHPPAEYPPADIVMCTLALHHFDPLAATTLLRHMRDLGRHIIVCDLVRSPLAYAGAVTLTTVTGMDAMTRHDGPISVKRAYTLQEMREMADAAGLPDARVRLVHPFRLVLTASSMKEVA